MSERPETGTTDVTGTAGVVNWPGWRPSGSTPWGESLWGTTIEYGQGAKLVIDRKGVGRFTDASGETGMWDPDLLEWVDEETGEQMHPQFGVPGSELPAETTNPGG
jgi:hypothetical protein